MAFGKLTPKMLKVIQPHVYQREVWDLGCGDGTRAMEIADLGAKKVTMVDKAGGTLTPQRKKIEFVQDYFESLKSPRWIEVAMVFWPYGYGTYHGDKDLMRHLRKSKVVVYLGSNVDGTSCGSPELFQYFITRELLGYVPNKQNSLIVLGKSLGPRGEVMRPPVGEERAGMRDRGELHYLTYEESEGKADKFEPLRKLARELTVGR